jgi:hypothetical protein
LLQRKKFWLIPVMMILLAIGAIVVVSAGSSFAPLIYAMF